MGLPSIHFTATGEIQTYFVPATGGYLIEAGGAQAHDGTPGKGDILKGMFYLTRGDVLKIVVGCRQPSPSFRRRMTCGGEGGSVVWRGAGELPIPAKLLLAAGGGQRDDDDPATPAWGASFNAGAFQSHQPAAHPGNGYVSITPLPVYNTPGRLPPEVSREPWLPAGGAAAPSLNCSNRVG